MQLSEETIQLDSIEYKIILSENFEGLSDSLKFLDRVSGFYILSEDHLLKHYRKDLELELNKLNVPVHFIEIKGKEQNKHISRTGDVYNKLIELGADRKSVLIAFGGGVVGDFSGFIAATYQRGIRFVQIPTTLLACVDSSVGGKVAVNADRGKNMIGAFHQPSLVFAPLHTLLNTLPEREWKCGISEVLKHSLLCGGEFFERMKHITIKNLRDLENVVFYIKESVKYKASIVKQDPKEKGIRAVLNLGHSLGHAIESLLSYKKLTHGEAISIGLITALLLSERRLNMPVQVTKDTLGMMKALGLPYQTSLNSAELIKHMKHDKKNSANKIFYVLLNSPGSPEFGIQVTPDELNEILHIQSKI